MGVMERIKEIEAEMARTRKFQWYLVQITANGRNAKPTGF
jgi:hypothetical protein